MISSMPAREHQPVVASLGAINISAAKAQYRRRGQVG
jgi:hypothetical protein